MQAATVIVLVNDLAAVRADLPSQVLQAAIHLLPQV